MPAVMAPSPMTATTLRPSPSLSAATAMPSAAPMEVLEWPTLSTSYSLSSRQGRVQAIFLANGVNALPSSGQDLVGIGLVAHVPHQPIEGVL